MLGRQRDLVIGVLLGLLVVSTPQVEAGGPSASTRALRDIAPLRSAAKRHPYTRKVLSRVTRDKLRTVDSVGDVTAERITERAGWVPLGADPDLRRVTVATVMRKIRSRSEDLRSLVRKRPEAAAWDIVFVGAGVHTAIVANSVSQLQTDTPFRMLTLEASNDIGGTFRAVGSTVARNSANRAQKRGKDSRKVRRGFGDKNPQRGPWGDADLDGQEWPELGIIADTATVNLFASGSDIMLDARVEKIEARSDVTGSEKWPAENRVTMTDGTVVYASTVVRSTGLGKPRPPVRDRDTLRLIQSERERIDFSKPDRVPDVLDYLDALTLANLSKTGRDPYRARPQPPRPFKRVEGLRVTTSEPTVLRVRDGRKFKEVELDDVLTVEYDAGDGEWRLQRGDGGVIEGEDLEAEVAGQVVRPVPGEDLAQLAGRLALVNLGRRPLEVDQTPVLARLKVSGRVGRSRVKRLKERLGDVVQIEVAGGRLESLDDIADVFADGDGGDVLVVRKDGSVATVKGPLRGNGARGKSSIAADDPLLAVPGSLPRPVIAVVGGRDSGRTFLEYLYGQAPASAYSGNGKIDVAQRGDVGDVEWYVGESGPADCPAFLQSTRSRYLRLAGKVREVGGSRPRAQLNKSRVDSVTRLDNGRYLITDSRGVQKVVDKVIFATGFENALEEDGEVEDVEGDLSGLDGDRIIARKVRGKSIYRIGPSSGNDVVGEDERFSTDENAGSIYAFAPRDRKFARKVLSRTQRARAAPDTASIDRTARLALAAGTSSAPIELSIGKPGPRLETPLDDLVMRSEVLDLLRGVRGDPSLAALQFRVGRDARGALVIRDMNHRGANEIARRIGRSQLLYEQLEEATEDGREVGFAVPLRAGVPLRAQLTIAQ